MSKRHFSKLVAVSVLLLPVLAWAQDPFSLAREKIERYKQAATAAAAPPMAPIAHREPPNRNDLLDAFGLFQGAGADETKDAKVRKEYAELLSLLGYYDLAAAQLERLAAESPQDAVLWRAAGMAWAESGPACDARALAALRKSLDLDPNSEGAADAWFYTGHVQHRAGQYDAAAQSYGEALTRKADHVRAVIGKAALDTRAGRIVEASSTLDAVGRAAQPYDIETRQLLRRALADFQAGGTQVPDDGAAQAAYSKLLYRAGRLPDAVTAGRRAAELKPDDVDMLNFLGAMFMQAGKADEARGAYEKSLAVKPDQPGITEALRQLGGQPGP